MLSYVHFMMTYCLDSFATTGTWEDRPVKSNDPYEQEKVSREIEMVNLLLLICAREWVKEIYHV